MEQDNNNTEIEEVKNNDSSNQNNRFNNKKIDIKDYFKGENQKKMIPFVLIGLVVVAMIFYAMSSDTTEKTDELSSPDREVENYNSKLEAQGDKKQESQASALENYQGVEQPMDENIEEFDPNAINQALANSGNNSNQQHNQSYGNSNYSEPTPSSNYNPYGNRDMYTIPERKAPSSNYKQSAQSSNYDNVQEPVYHQPTISNHTPQQTKNNVWKNQRLTSQNSNGNSINRGEAKVYKASIVSGRSKYITPENNRVQIRVIEPFSVNGVNVPRTTQLIAYAQFDKQLKLEIKSIVLNNKQVPVSISVLDLQGQEAIEIVGGTGAELSQEGQDEVISSTRTGNSIVDKTVSIFTGKKKPKAIISSDYVYLRIN